MSIQNWIALSVIVVFGAAFLALLYVTIRFGIYLIAFSFYNNKAIRHYEEAEKLCLEYKRGKKLETANEANFNLRKAEHYSKKADRYYDLLIKRKRQK